MKIVPEVESVTIVVAGHFNPAIFSPHWFSRNGLIENQDADAATVEILHRDVASFHANWLGFYADGERVQLIATDPIHSRILDLFVGLFGEKLPHTPLRATGINYATHFRVASHSVLNKLGDELAPKEPWGAWGRELLQSAPETHPLSKLAGDVRVGGLRSITMIRNVRSDGAAGHVQAKLEPSLLYRPGVFIEVNDHYEAPTELGEEGPNLVGLVSENFDRSLALSRSVAEHFMKKSEEYGFERP